MSEWQDNTGVCPVEAGVLVDIELRHGAKVYHTPALTLDEEDIGVDEYGRPSFYAAFDWSIDNAGGDIIKWRLHEEEGQDE